MTEMISKQKYQSYATATQTVARTKQIVMLYDGVIRFVQQAKEAIADKRIEDRYKILTKASEVIIGLQSCLDFEHGESIARVLYGFYSSIDSRIVSIHRTNSLEACDEIISEMKKMRDVWHEIDQKNDADTKPASASAAPSTSGANDSQQGIILSA